MEPSQLGWVIPVRVPDRRSVGVGWWKRIETAKSASGSSFMLVLVS